ncbi:MAG: hypothetical protein CL610_01140 [Anaerolineaceae bacterium]|nr:hypothetical protein [Anaerolineaceae bacterium]
MLAEQTVTCRYKANGQLETAVEIQMTIQLERRPDDYGGVEIWKDFDPSIDDLPEDIFLKILDRFNNGVHGGYGTSNVPYIPDTILAVKISDIKVSPSFESFPLAYDKGDLGYMLEVTVSGIVNTLCRSLENLRTGQEIYGDNGDLIKIDHSNIAAGKTLITRQIILERLDAYLNHQITLVELVDWAENALTEPDIPENENADLIMDVLMYLGAADTHGFPLTWDVLSDFMDKLGGSVRVIVESV